MNLRKYKDIPQSPFRKTKSSNYTTEGRKMLISYDGGTVCVSLVGKPITRS